MKAGLIDLDMDTTAGFRVAVLLGFTFHMCHGLRCYTCTVDFRSQPFDLNNTCLFPKNHDDLVHCSSGSKFCKATITRVGGVFVMLSRSCTPECMEACTEKGYGIRFKDCTNCCTKDDTCGTSSLMKNKKKFEDKGRGRDDNKKSSCKSINTSWNVPWLVSALLILSL